MKHNYQSLLDFVKSIFLAMGCNEEDAFVTAEVLLAAELRNINSHGIIRIKDYYHLWKQNRINTTPAIRITHQTPSTAVVDGDSGLGMAVGKRSMEIAIEKAHQVGTGWVAVNNSNHYGIAGYYAMMALEHDMIGISLTNANPLVAPTFSTDKLLGTNPIAVAIPAGEEHPFVADFATTPIARGKLAVMHKKGEKAPLGYVQDKDGQPSDDPDILTQGGAILPLGSDPEHGSHKGYCLGAIVDILSAVLPGANYGPWVPPSVPFLKVQDNLPGKGTGHFLGAMRIDAFRDSGEFKRMMDDWIRTFKSAKPAIGQQQVFIPGELERISEEQKRREGIEILGVISDDLGTITEELGIQNIFAATV